MTALILKSLQNDFMSLGATPIAGADEMVIKANLAIENHDIVIAIQKWYPADHKSFAANHPWRKPDQEITVEEEPIKLEIMNCVADSFGAAFHTDLNTDKINYIIKNEGQGGDAIMEEINKIVLEHKVEEIEVLGPEEEMEPESTSE